MNETDVAARITNSLGDLYSHVYVNRRDRIGEISFERLSNA